MGTHPGSHPRPRFDIADIVRAHRAELAQRFRLRTGERRVLSAIALCRTAALGGFLDRCRSCGDEHPAYNSCRNRHCPKCQALAQEQWIAARAKRLLPVRHFHVVFTLPSELRALCRHAPRAMYSGLLQAAARTVLDLAASQWAAVPGVTTVLHTWTRALLFHPHVHLLVSAGGLALDAKSWVARKRYLFPVPMMRIVFRAKMLEALHCMHEQGFFEGFDAFEDPEAFDRLLAKLKRLDWVLNVRPPFRRAEHVLRYLGRYTHRVAISNSRFVDVTPSAVTFRTHGADKVTLSPVEFLRRFLLHVLPDKLHKIRHYGLYCGAYAETHWVTAQKLLRGPDSHAADPPAGGEKTPPLSWADRLRALTGKDARLCRRCGGPVDRILLPRNRSFDPFALARAPPAAAV